MILFPFYSKGCNDTFIMRKKIFLSTLQFYYEKIKALSIYRKIIIFTKF